MPTYTAVADTVTGELTIHDPGCADVQIARASGVPMMTMVDGRPLPHNRGYVTHECLDRERDQADEFRRRREQAQSRMRR